MAKFQFRERIPIDVPHTLMQLLSRFQGVRDGLPELIKNSKDQYSRLGITDSAERTIVVVVNTDDRCIGVIDFAGASADQFKRWETWSDPTANTKERAADIEGGHGNGGKAFMVLGSISDSSFESCFQGRRTRMGYENESERARFKPGIALENGKAVEDQQITSVGKLFERSLSELGVKLRQLPKPAQEAFVTRQAYTIAQVNGIKEWSKAREETVRRLVAELPSAVEIHPQAALTLESCSVWFVIDGRVVGEGPAQVRYPEPFPGFEESLRISVPDELVDRQTRERVSTGPPNDAKLLTLRTSAKSLRTEDMRPLHVIRVRNARNVVALWGVAELCSVDSSRFVFGEITIPILEFSRFAGSPTTDMPLARALSQWTTEELTELSDKIQRRIGYTKEEQDRVNECLAEMRSAMSAFLNGKRPKSHVVLRRRH